MQDGQHQSRVARPKYAIDEVTLCLGDLSRLAPDGFTVKDHDLTLYGDYKDCQ